MLNAQCPVPNKYWAWCHPTLEDPPTIKYPQCEVGGIENMGSMVEVLIDGAMISEGKMYGLKQYHLHAPTEHLVNMQFYPMKVYFVNIASGKLKELKTFCLNFIHMIRWFHSCPGSPLQTIPHQNQCKPPKPLSTPLHAITEPGNSTTTGPLFSNITNFFNTTPLKFKYTRSFMTPPCTDSVIFLVAHIFLLIAQKYCTTCANNDDMYLRYKEKDVLICKLVPTVARHVV